MLFSIGRQTSAFPTVIRSPRILSLLEASLANPCQTCFRSLLSLITDHVLSLIFTVVLFLSMFRAVICTAIVVKQIVSSQKAKFLLQAPKPTSATVCVITVLNFFVIFSCYY